MTRERLWKQIQENKTIKQLENENADLKHSLDWANEREHDDYVKIQELEKEKCELLGIIQEKDKLIEEMKCCENCKYNSYWGNELHCNYGLKEALLEDKLVECEEMNKWEMKKND